ncbi:MAG: SWIM zinc finger family protein [Verrucomicrobiota bacterium]|nr:SWIM zinc finger family protein [Verrucomicrobiota bacterium]
MSWGYGGYAPYESVATKKNKAKKKIAALRKKGKEISPVEINGRTIAKSWWGKAWNKNLANYADFSNRLSRGRSYVTHGCVIDLQIDKNLITAQIMGSGRSIYKAEIRIDSLKKNQWNKIKKMVKGNIGSLKELLTGKFPKEMDSILSNKKNGLFPAPKEFHPACDCPDYSKFCKHLAAVIYGIGNRLDAEPNLLFTLRGVNPNELVSKIVNEEKDNMISKAKNVKSKRVMNLKEKKLSKMFDINFTK